MFLTQQKIPNLPYFKTGVCLLAMLLGLGLSAPAWSDETDLLLPLQPLAATPATPATPLSRLQQFTHRASDLAVSAIGMLGIRYKLGGSDPDSGLDCSGLVRYVFKQAWGKDLPRTSQEISQVGNRIEPKDLQPGDLVFYNTVRRGFSHVGIYLGDSKFIHAPRAGAEVRIESMDVGYWKQRFNGARRINQPEPQ